ncbi:MAG: alpha-L-rhamnosidase [Verrucomicrobiaceae bacterium]|nr:MAG: alpha-L-rhamnosidase [Verrucomicrobiaceae bacterium]
MSPKQLKSAEIFKKARWIWPDNHGWDLHNSYALFRKKFRLENVPVRALLAITADQSYQLYLNGRYVCRGPARGFQKSWPYDEVDVSSYLRKGRNVLAVRAHHPGFSNFQYVTQGWAGLLVAAKWGKTEIFSDKSWRCRRQTGLRRDTVPVSLQLFCQEHIDLREEPPDWMEPGFDDSGWTSPAVEHPWNGMPWYELEPRGIPMLEEKEVAPVRCLGTAEGRCRAGYLDTRDITRIRHAEGLTHRMEDISVGSVAVLPTGKKRFRSYLIDFGWTVVGSVGFEIAGAKGGEIVDTLHVETIDPDTLEPHFIPDRHCRMAFGHRLICRPGDQTHVFYHAFGFRFMVLTVRDNEADLVIRPFLRTTLYPLAKKGGFQSSDAALQRIWETCAWTQRVCSLDAYIDTPWREQAQWWGDARVQAKNTFFYSGDTRLFRRGIAQIAGQSLQNGLTYGHAPTMAHSCILPDFTLIWFITIWDYYWQTGSLEPFEAHQRTILEALKYFKDKTDSKTGLVSYDERYWLFLDWTGLPKEGSSTIYNLWLLIALERMAEMYRKARMPAEARSLTAWAGRLRKALSKLVRRDGLLCDGLTATGKLIKTTSIHAQTLAILAGFEPQHDAARVENVLLPFIRQQHVPEIYPSCYWITYVFEVLTARGHSAEVLEFIRDKWTPMSEHGTTWEVFNPRLGDESFSHAWSAHPLYHLMQTVGGIRQTAPAWDKILFQPTFEGDRAETIVPTPHGPIRGAWERTAAEIKVRLDLPKGITAKVILSGQRLRTVKGRSSWRVAL